MSVLEERHGNITEYEYQQRKKREKDDVLNKIRAEIEQAMKYQYAIGEDEYAEGFEKSMEIIDKYRED